MPVHTGDSSARCEVDPDGSALEQLLDLVFGPQQQLVGSAKSLLLRQAQATLSRSPTRTWRRLSINPRAAGSSC